MTAQLSWHVQNFVVITMYITKWQQNKSSDKFELSWIKSQVERSPIACQCPIEAGGSLMALTVLYGLEQEPREGTQVLAEALTKLRL